EQGTLAPIEVTRAEAQVAANRGALVTAIGLVEQQELIVKRMITRGGLAIPAILAAHIIATDTLHVPDVEPVRPLQDLIAEAVMRRPDLVQANIQVENSFISLEGSVNALRPELDLVGMVQNGGLSGEPNLLAGLTPGLSLYPGGYGTTIGQVFKNNFPTYGI